MCKCLCMYVHACMKESSCFSLWQHDQRKNSYVEEAIMHKREVENFQNYQSAYFPAEGRAKKLVKLQGVVCGLHEEHGIQEFQVSENDNLSPWKFRILLFTLKIACWHLQLSPRPHPNNSPELCHLTTVLNFPFFKQTKRKGNYVFK